MHIPLYNESETYGSRAKYGSFDEMASGSLVHRKILPSILSKSLAMPSIFATKVVY